MLAEYQPDPSYNQHICYFIFLDVASNIFASPNSVRKKEFLASFYSYQSHEKRQRRGGFNTPIGNLSPSLEFKACTFENRFMYQSGVQACTFENIKFMSYSIDA